MPTRDELLEQTRHAEGSHFWFHGFRRFMVPVLRQVAGERRGLRLIDCGCGTGANLALLRPYGEAFGFDLLAGGRHARTLGGHVTRADITRIPFRTGVFDVVTAFDVLQCVGADHEAIAEMARIARPGGTIVLTLAALDVLRGDHAEAWHELRRYTPARAARLVQTAGLEVERLSFLFGSVFPLMLAVRVAQRLSRPFRTRPGAWDMTVPPAPVNAALSAVVGAEAALARHVPLPIGSSLVVVARKRGGLKRQ
jgi:SAM-dependent methyltransferase